MKKIIVIILFLIIFSLKINDIIITKKTHNMILKSQIGILEIPILKLKKEIIEGTDKDILNNNFIGHIKESYFDFENTIILAGHNDTIFKSIHKLKTQDEIILIIKNESKKYCVFKNTKIDKNDYTLFKNNGPLLILITCTDDSDERRIILAKKCM